MREMNADLWKTDFQVRCVTTNGMVVNGGRNPMGGGVAREAVDRYPGMDYTLGSFIKLMGNHVFILLMEKDYKSFVVSFPTIEQLGNGASIQTIIRSCVELNKMADAFGWTNIGLPRPGAGLGGLDWESQVKPICEKYFLDDRVVLLDRSL